jgi:hypothetical protein
MAFLSGRLWAHSLSFLSGLSRCGHFHISMTPRPLLLHCRGPASPACIPSCKALHAGICCTLRCQHVVTHAVVADSLVKWRGGVEKVCGYDSRPLAYYVHRRPEASMPRLCFPGHRVSAWDLNVSRSPNGLHINNACATCPPARQPWQLFLHGFMAMFYRTSPSAPTSGVLKVTSTPEPTSPTLSLHLSDMGAA